MSTCIVHNCQKNNTLAKSTADKQCLSSDDGCKWLPAEEYTSVFYQVTMQVVSGSPLHIRMLNELMN